MAKKRGAFNARQDIEALKAENEQLTRANLFFREHEAALYEIFDQQIKGKEGTFQFDTIVSRAKGLKAERDRYKAALEKIAKPALGGKQQQYIAQQALASTSKH